MRNGVFFVGHSFTPEGTGLHNSEFALNWYRLHTAVATTLVWTFCLCHRRIVVARLELLEVFVQQFGFNTGGLSTEVCLRSLNFV